MKLHIFVATTQGLVAIQNIIAIDDADISSIVSVNGTSTTANISSAYHNFVKKGAGIIAQDFGICSYRLNVSERIDHGNSWQLAFYLAHAASEQNLLGDGLVQSGDHIICATGELNTTSRHIQAVGQVRLKQDLAIDTIVQWQEMAAEISFLIPNDNADEIATDFPIEVTPITSLEQALSYLPTLAATKETESVCTSKERKKNGEADIIAKPTTTNNDQTPHRNRKFLSKQLVVVVIGLAIIIAWFQQELFVEQNNPRPTTIEAKLKQHLEQQKKDTQSEKSQQTLKSPESTPESKVELAASQVNMVATFAKYGDCKGELDMQTVQKKGLLFKATELADLCQLIFATSENITTVILIAADTQAVKVLNNNDGFWQIPLPKNRAKDRNYYLLSLNKKFNKKLNAEVRSQQSDYQQS